MSNSIAKFKKRKILLRRQNYRCWLCDLPLGLHEATLDHLIPKSKGGTGDIGNLKLAHKTCNQGRGNSLEQVFLVCEGTVALRWNVRSVGRF